MAKGNLFLGQARGKIGDIVLTHINGVQVSRPRNRKPKNPRTPYQLLQRVVLKTTSAAYSFLQEICDHSFQGHREGTPCQSQFMKRNVALLRSMLSDEINSRNWGDIMLSEKANYLGRDEYGCEYMPWILSDGSLAAINVNWTTYTTGTGFMIESPVAFQLPQGQTEPTYADMLRFFAAERGDQLTFIFMTINDDVNDGHFNGFHIARVILDPANGDMSQPFVSSIGNILQPNERNEGSVTMKFVPDTHFLLETERADGDAGSFYSLAACAVILSRQSTSGVWQRSPASLVLRPDMTVSGAPSPLLVDHGVNYLGDAVASFLSPEEDSTLYLNQATRSF